MRLSRGAMILAAAAVARCTRNNTGFEAFAIDLIAFDACEMGVRNYSFLIFLSGASGGMICRRGTACRTG